MCKVLIVPGIKKNKISLVKQLAEEMTKEFAKTEEDGVGYAAITANGQIYGEKWLNPADAFVVKSQPKPPEPTAGELFITENLGALVKPDKKIDYEIIYDRFGVPITQKTIDNTVAFMLHARKKTYGARSIDNTHPFVITNDKYVNDIALIHNGSINNHYNLTKKLSTCDSEVILHEYLKLGMTEYPEAMTTLADTLRGQYAVGVFGSMVDKDGELIPYVDIFKSSKYLTVAYIKELETVVFATYKHDLVTACETLNWTIEYSGEVQDEYLVRLNAVTGERLIDLVKFTKSLDTSFSSYYPYGGPNNRSENLTETKASFQEQNKDLFMEPYYEVPDLSEEDKTLMRELEKSTNKTQIRALALVKKAVGQA